MILTVNEIAGRVRTALRFDACPESLYDDTPDEEKFNRLIRAAIEPAARKALLESDLAGLAGSGRDFRNGTVYTGEDGSGYVLLPSDYLRLLAFRMSDWEIAVHHTIPVDSEQYKRASSCWRGIGANPWHPVCAESASINGRALEFRGSLSEEATVALALYVPEPRIAADDSIEIPDQLVDRVIGMVILQVETTR